MPCRFQHVYTITYKLRYHINKNNNNNDTNNNHYKHSFIHLYSFTLIHRFVVLLITDSTNLTKKYSSYLSLFTSGVMLALAFLEFIPEVSSV